MAPPKLPIGQVYDDLVEFTVLFGLGTALALTGSVQPGSFRTGWIVKANKGIEPYAAWMGRFRRDVAEYRAFHRVASGPRSLDVMRCLRGDYDG